MSNFTGPAYHPKEKTLADDLYEKIATVSAENRRLKSRLEKVWVKAVEGLNGGPGKGGGAVAWRDALAEIETMAK